MHSHDRLCTARAWLFDLDGTLVEQRVDFELMRTRVMAIIVDMDLAEHVSPGLRVLELVNQVEQGTAGSSIEAAAAFRSAADAAIEAVELLAVPSASVLPGVPELFDVLKSRRLPIAVVTRNCRAAAVQILQTSGLGHDMLVAREDTPRVKPHPEHLTLALDAFGIPGTESVMCGDYVMDVLAGTAVGALTVAVASDGDLGRFEGSSPDLTVRGVGELISWM